MLNAEMDIDKYQLEERYLWWALYAFKLANAEFSLYGLVEGCRDWSDGGASARIGCVWGVISTIVMLGEGAKSSYNTYSVIDSALTNSGFNIFGVGAKREYIDYNTISHQLNTELSRILRTPVASLHRANGSITQNDQTGFSIHVVELPSGQ